jgi:hypothetical protein
MWLCMGKSEALGAVPFTLLKEVADVAVYVQVKGPCALPFTLAKQTALRIALDQLYGPRVNLFLTRVLKVCHRLELYSYQSLLDGCDESR